ncbi:hypothetical protein [Shewanella marina]|uniref:hypothetical protein n=1 Tax=Shewanella marina TaxID=487319 RepID=UPI000AE22412|nr:hypothetical protein [Shewanella marina]
MSTVNYKYLANTGMVFMAVGSLMACLAQQPISLIGDGILIIGLIISTWGFSGWRP